MILGMMLQAALPLIRPSDMSNVEAMSNFCAARDYDQTPVGELQRFLSNNRFSTGQILRVYDICSAFRKSGKAGVAKALGQPVLPTGENNVGGASGSIDPVWAVTILISDGQSGKVGMVKYLSPAFGSRQACETKLDTMNTTKVSDEVSVGYSCNRIR